MSFIEEGDVKCCIICADKEKSGKARRSKGGVRMPDTIQMVLDKVQVFLAQWLDRHLKQIYQKDFWRRAVLGVLTAEQMENVEESGASSLDDLDFATLIAVFLGNFKALRKLTHLDPELSDMAKHAKKIRNLFAHRDVRTIENPDAKKVRYQIDSLRHFLEGLGADESLVREIWGIHETVAPKAQTVSSVQGDQIPSVPTTTTRLPSGIKISVSAAPTPRQQEVPTPSRKTSMTTPKPNTTKIVTAEKQDTAANGSQKAASTSVASATNAIEHCSNEQVSGYCQQINFAARGVYGDIFTADAKVIEGGHRDKSPVKGRGNWDFLIVMPFTCDASKALDSARNSWTCPAASPYCESGYVVWEFPSCEKPCEVSMKPEVPAFYTCGYLPAALDAYISSRPGTDYRPDSGRVQSNLHAAEHDADWYLGNYFPRTFAETFCLYDYAFSFGFDAVCGGKSELTILDVGIGSGGATYGLIWALRKRLLGDDSFKKIKVIGFDGNQNALSIFQDMKPIVENAWPIKFEFLTEKVQFSSASLIPKDTFDGKADFVMASKCLQEACHHPSEARPLYVRYFADAQSIASPDALISVLEIDNDGRGVALEDVLRNVGSDRAVVVPRHEDGIHVGRERLALSSVRLPTTVAEDVLFAVVGPTSLVGRIPKWRSISPLPLADERESDNFGRFAHRCREPLLLV